MPGRKKVKSRAHEEQARVTSIEAPAGELVLDREGTIALRSAVESALQGISLEGAAVVVLNVNLKLSVRADCGSQVAIAGGRIRNRIEGEHVAALGGRLTVTN